MTMSVSELRGVFGLLRIEQEFEQLTSSSPEPDPAWSYTDRAGHWHYPELRPGRLGASVAGYPTLRWRPDLVWCPECRDTHDEGGWVCARCGEPITPGSRPPSLAPRLLPTRTSYYLNGEPITREQVELLAAEALEQEDDA